MIIRMFFVAAMSLVLTACGNGPKSVAQQYWQGIIDRDESAVAAASSQRSRQELWQTVAPEQNMQVRFGETVIEDDIATVVTDITWADKDRDQPVELHLLTMLVKEDEQWKVNTARTRQQFFTAVYRTSLEGLSSALAESLTAFQALGEEAATDFTNELSRAIDQLQQQSDQANEEIQDFLQQLDQDLQDQINAINR